MNEFGVLLLGALALGVIHSFDPDHVAAMSTLLGRKRKGLSHAFVLGSIWGAGHTLSLALLGVLLVSLDAQVSGMWERAFEASVGALLIYLGVTRLRDARRRPHLHVHRHDGVEHAHYHLHRMRVDHKAGEAHKRHSHAPLWVGMLHGLAGTAGMMALLPAVIIGDVGHYVIYILTFGLGSTLAMATFCTGIGHLTVRLQQGPGERHRWWPAFAGSLSLGLGFLWLGGTLLA